MEKTLIIFYSYTGKTKCLAEELAGKENADIAEILDIKRPSTVNAYLGGCFAAMRGKAWPIRPLTADLSAYKRLILLAPVWAGNPPPAFNAVLAQLPDGGTIAVKMISASGKSSCKTRIATVLKAKGCTLESFEDIKV
jgi:flavodoxin